jgi:transposase
VSMDIDTHKNLGDRLEVIETGRRRRWSDDAKRRIVEESLVYGTSASAVARRHGISPAHLFAWRRTYAETLRADEPKFIPLTVADPGDGTRPRTEGSMSIVLRDGRRIVVRGAFDEEALRRLVRVAETA